MTTTTPTLGHRPHLVGSRTSHAIDRVIARVAIAMLRWTNDRRRRVTAERHAMLRTLESNRAAREHSALSLSTMRGY